MSGAGGRAARAVDRVGRGRVARRGDRAGALRARRARRRVAARAETLGGARHVAALAECHVAGIRNGVLCGTLQRPLDPAHPERDADRDPLRRRAGDGAAQVRRSGVPARRRPGAERDRRRGGDDAAVQPPQQPARHRLRRPARHRRLGAAGVRTIPSTRRSPSSPIPSASSAWPLQCKAALLKLPYIRSESDLGLFTTSIAVQDLDAVRRALGAERIDLVGASYGTRVALEYQRQFPQHGAAQRDRRRRAARHGAAGELLDRQPGGVRRAARRLRRRAGVRARPSRSARALRGAAAVAAAHGQGGASAERPRRGVRR